MDTWMKESFVNQKYSCFAAIRQTPQKENDETRTINLGANAAMHVFPANAMGRLTPFLLQEFELLGEWEVALLESFWPANF